MQLAEMAKDQLIQEVQRLRKQLAQDNAVAPAASPVPQSDADWRSMLATMSVRMYLVDAKGAIRYANAGLHGDDVTQVLGKRMHDYLAADQHATLDHAISQGFQQGAAMEFLLACDETDPRSWYDCHSHPWHRDGQVAGCLITCRDATEVRETEMALQVSEQKFRMLADNIPGAVYLCRNDARYTMLYLNDAIATLTGYPKETFLDDRISIVDLYHPDDQPTIAAQVDGAVGRREPFHISYRIKHRTLGYRWIDEVGVGVFLDGALTYLEGFMSDVTEERQARDRVQKMGEMLEGILSNLPVLVFRVDAQGTLTESVGAGLRRLGFEDGQAVGMDAYDISPASKPYLQAALGGETVHYEVAGDTDGERWWFDNYVFPDQMPSPGAVGFSIDITERKLMEAALQEAHDNLEQRVLERTAALRETNESLKREVAERRRAEVALRASEERLRAFAEALPDIALVIDETGKYVQVLAARPGLLAAEASALDGKSMAEVLDTDVAHQCLQTIAKTLDTGEPQRLEYVLHVPAGTRTFEGRTSPMSLRIDGKRTVVWVAADITERRQMQQRVRQHEQELAHVARVNTLGEMATVMAHELNQPLAAISNYAGGCLRRVREGQFDHAQLEQALEETARQANRAGEIIRHIRSFVTKREIQRQDIDINHIAKQAMELTHAAANHARVQVVDALGTDLPQVHADPIQTEQVLVNLIQNAVEAATLTAGPRRVTVSTRRENDRVIMAVSDTGPGLTAQQRTQPFEPFFTTKPHGMGMGLTICRSIVEAHGGRLAFLNTDENGATVEVRLPC